jgi:PAS domain S-box-containing protein
MTDAVVRTPVPAQAPAVTPIERLRWGAYDAVAVLAVDGTVLDASADFHSLLGYDPPAWIGLNALHLVHPDDVEHALRSLAGTAGRAGLHEPADFRLVAADGSVRAVEVIGENRMGDRDVGGIVLHIRDVRDRSYVEALAAGQIEILELSARGRPLPETLGALAGLIEQVQAGTMLAVLRRHGRGPLHVVAAPSVPAAWLDRLAATGGATPTTTLAVERSEAVVTADVTLDPAWADLASAAQAAGIRACWSLPVKSFEEGEVLGAVDLYWRAPGAPHREDWPVLTLAARLAAVVLERADAARS